MSETNYQVNPIGFVQSDLESLDDAPKQGGEGAPAAWIEIEPQFAPGFMGLEVGEELFLLTWLHLADRTVLQVHPRRDGKRALKGVFATRSPARPNPIGLHRVYVLEVADQSIRVSPLEAVNGTPVLDIKPVLTGSDILSR